MDLPLNFELLGNPRHKKHYKSIIKHGSIFKCPPIERLTLYYARKLNVDDDENLDLIDSMTVNGLHYDFFGIQKGENYLTTKLI